MDGEVGADLNVCAAAAASEIPAVARKGSELPARFSITEDVVKVGQMTCSGSACLRLCSALESAGHTKIWGEKLTQEARLD